MESAVTMQDAAVVIVGAGPSGLAVSACLNHYNISNIVLERENCCASLWKNRSYDRLKLHLAKEFCSLPYMPHSPSSPRFIPKNAFIQYLDEYVIRFDIKPFYCRSVVSAFYDEGAETWWIQAENTKTRVVEDYVARFLVVATGENSEGFVPELPGLDSFAGEILHSSHYKNGVEYCGKKVLVVGCGNSGMEISFDLSNHCAKTSIVVRSPFHLLNKEMVYIGMLLLKFGFPVSLVDFFIILLAKFVFGDLSNFGIHRPRKGPFQLKAETGRSPVIDVGTTKRIRAGEILVYPALASIDGRRVAFENGVEEEFDVLIFATGYKSTSNNWLMDYKYALNSNGMPKNSFPMHWKGENGLYCVGLSRRGLHGISMDAKAIAEDVKLSLNRKKEYMYSL